MRQRLAMLAAGALCATGAISSAETLEKRTAVVVGADDGGEGSRPLRYAEHDADRIHQILTTIGGIAPQDAVLLHQPTADQILKALDAADHEAAGGLVLFYFSGHAHGGDLRLGGTALPLSTLRARLAGLTARTKIAVLDSCRSGEIIRPKGGRVAPAFEVSDDSVGPHGLAVVASSAADEDSQESDLLGASFFTHFFASGLLGDADANADGRVSLQEAYDYAYGRTVAETSEAGAVQHPTYQYRLSGAGELWMTDVSRAKSTLVFGPGSAGSYVIVDANKRTLVAEVTKRPDSSRRVALPAGTYEIKRADGHSALFARVQLADGDTVTLNDSDMSRVALARNLSKGVEWAGDLATVRPSRWAIAGSFGGQLFFAGATRTGLFPNMPMGGFDIETRDLFDARGSVLALDASAGTAPLTVMEGADAIATQVTEWTAGLSYSYEFLPGRVRPYVGGRLSVVGVNRTFTGGQIAGQSLLTMAPGVVAGVDVDLVSHLSAGLRARASYLLYQSDDNLSLGYADAGLLLRWEF
jgi:hypothetical protein